MSQERFNVKLMKNKTYRYANLSPKRSNHQHYFWPLPFTNEPLYITRQAALSTSLCQVYLPHYWRRSY